MDITAFFSSVGVPAEGLTPTLKIVDIATNTIVVNDDPMDELQLGFYTYDFTIFDVSKKYVILIDGGDTLGGAERYAISSIPSDGISGLSIGKIL